MEIAEAAVEAARLRFRPILMTSFAFILGVVPLVLATGAGANARKSIGIAVLSGMLASTCLAVLFVPSFYVVLQRFEEWQKSRKTDKKADEKTPADPNLRSRPQRKWRTRWVCQSRSRRCRRQEKHHDPTHPLRKTHLGIERPPFECIALVLQGGGALGAFQAGVYQGLAEANLHPDWVAGISIGAINAALIAGNPPEARVDKLRAFWDRVTTPMFLARLRSARNTSWAMSRAGFVNQMHCRARLGAEARRGSSRRA